MALVHHKLGILEYLYMVSWSLPTHNNAIPADGHGNAGFGFLFFCT